MATTEKDGAYNEEFPANQRRKSSVVADINMNKNLDAK